MRAEKQSELRAVVEAIYAAWSARDLAGTLAGFAEDCTYCLHVPADVLPYGGTHTGKAAIGDCLQSILTDYGFLAYVVDGLVVEGDRAHAQIVYYYRHTASGQQIDGRFRHVWQLRDGQVVRVDEYHDVPRLKAFLDMVREMIDS